MLGMGGLVRLSEMAAVRIDRRRLFRGLTLNSLGAIAGLASATRVVDASAFSRMEIVAQPSRPPPVPMGTNPKLPLACGYECYRQTVSCCSFGNPDGTTTFVQNYRCYSQCCNDFFDLCAHICPSNVAVFCYSNDCGC